MKITKFIYQLVIMETPYLPKAIFGEDFKHVYEPAEDTFLLLDALERNLGELKKNAMVCLECGSGSGTITTALSKALNDEEQLSRLMIATDINPAACKMTQKSSKYHNQNHVNVIRTNLAECLLDRLASQVDLLIFNPPYVPTESNEMNIQSDNQLNLSWAGGKDGRKLIDVFLKDYVKKLLSKSCGSAYLVALEQNNIDDLLSFLEPDLTGNIVMQRRAGREMLYIIKYQWR